MATAVSVVLTAGLTGPATEAGAADGPARTTGAQMGQQHRITLITGDRVLVDPKGRVTGHEQPEDRRGIPLRIRTHGGSTHVIPLDAQRLIATGRLDPRLFDITELNKPASRAAYRKGVKAIVGYRGPSAEPARARVRAAQDSPVRATLTALNADAVTAPADGGSGLWKALTRPGRGGTAATEVGVERIWLDTVRSASLESSAGQIGAPAAWQAGYDGTGVSIAVLDTGIDAAHPDLAGRVRSERNFSDAPDAKDRQGHGTHVASTAAGTGARSDGKFKGVAPGAQLLNAKVLNDAGFGTDSGIIQGIDWAVAQGADIVNLSLGSRDTPGIDPLEAQINKVSADTGVLFAVAAGNSGPQVGTVESPGSADAAVTVGSVDDQDRLARLSSRGPRTGDGGLKPDVTAPGVGITAAAASGTGQPGDPAGYTSLDGTSMATPHAAGTAALLKQKHPGWNGARLKAALTGSAVPGAHTAYEQGSGRISVEGALGQSVFAEPVSFDFGTQRWPRHDDKPVTRNVTYRNLGTAPVTLDLAVEAADPRGRPAPAGFFTLDTSRVTVPAGGTTSVGLTADTRAGTVDGHYSAAVIAAGGGRTIRTVAAVDREIESYNLTLQHIKRPGSENWATDLLGVGGLADTLRFSPDLSAGTVTLRVPTGEYVLELIDRNGVTKALDQMVQPKLTVVKDTTVTLDARTTKTVDITVPDSRAVPVQWDVQYLVERGAHGAGNALATGVGTDELRTAHLGPEITDGSLRQMWQKQWMRGTTDHGALFGGPVRRLASGLTKHYTTDEMAKVQVGQGSSAPGKRSELVVRGHIPGRGDWVWMPAVQPAPATRTVWLSTADHVTWDMASYHLGPDGADGWPTLEGTYVFPGRKTYRAGKTYREQFNTAVHSPLLTGESGVYRDGDTLQGTLSLFADGQGNPGSTPFASVDTVLRRGKTVVSRNQDPLDGTGSIIVPPGKGTYTLANTVTRAPDIAKAAGRIDARWTFPSETTASRTRLPVSTVRFGAAVGLDGTAPAGRAQVVPLTVQGAAANGNLSSLEVTASYDEGATWQKLPVTGGAVTLRNPAQGRAVSLRATVADKQGNRGSVTIHNAYHGK
ncbi:S8 family serine peptidase [Streptomyces sp. NPDC020965]|uniref:S8 family serine peptidase n=1 Tax=Streptomyces sp. NPDC020965 TaxID=3365105 RepID=UPI0037994CC0